MRDSSQLVTSNMSAVSAVEENAAAASQMKTTTAEVTATIFPGARAANEQVHAARSAGIATTELATGVDQIDLTAGGLRLFQAELLDALIARFTVDDRRSAGRAFDVASERIDAGIDG